MKPDSKKNPRREFLFVASGMAAGFTIKSSTTAAAESAAMSTAPPATREAIRKVVGSANINRGKVTLELPALVENGNAVPLTVSIDSPMTRADHVKAVHIFTEKNPLPNVVSFFLGPRAGRARITTRIRLADTQTVSAVCELSDGSFWSGSMDVVVTLAACTEVI